jgi:hypothetical protein
VTPSAHTTRHSCARSGADVAGHHRGHPRRRRAQDHQHEAEGGDGFGDPLAGAAAQPGRELQNGRVEHRMRQPGAEHRADELRRDVRREQRARQQPAHRQHDRHGGVHVRAADRAEHLDQEVQAAGRRQRVGQQRDRDVAAGQPLGHDAGADHDREQQGGGQRFREQLARGRELHGQRAAMAASADRSSASPSVCSGNCSSCSMR